MKNILTISGVVKEVTTRTFAKKDGSEGTKYDVVIEYDDGGRIPANLVASTTKKEVVDSLQVNGQQEFNIIVRSTFHQGSGRWFTNANIISIL